MKLVMTEPELNELVASALMNKSIQVPIGGKLVVREVCQLLSGSFRVDFRVESPK